MSPFTEGVQVVTAKVKSNFEQPSRGQAQLTKGKDLEIKNMSIPTINPQAPVSDLIGSAILFRRLGPQTPEFSEIVRELRKPPKNRDIQYLQGLRERVIKKTGLAELVTKVPDALSFARLIADFDPDVQFLRNDELASVFRLFRPRRGPRSNAGDYVQEHKVELRARLESMLERICARTAQGGIEMLAEQYRPDREQDEQESETLNDIIRNVADDIFGSSEYCKFRSVKRAFEKQFPDLMNQILKL
jgi:hypothetical protein